MRIVSLLLINGLLTGGPVQAGGLLSRVIWGSEGSRRPLIARGGGVKMLELEVVERPPRAIAAEFATVRFRVKQLSNPDPQFVGPPVRLRRFSLSGEQFEQQWLHPNGAGIYETSVPMREARVHYLYFETGNNKLVLAKVPWVVLLSAE